VGLAALLAAATIAVTPTSFLQSRQGADGGFAEASGTSSPELTAWAALGLRSTGTSTGNALPYLVSHEREVTTPTSIALVALAQSALGREPDALLARLPARPHAVNEAIWDILALRQAHRPVPKTLVAYLVRSQSRTGGFSWSRGLRPDSNDTAFAIQALRAAGVSGKPISRAVAFLRGFQRRDGGFELARGRGSDAQSTAVAIQGFLAARVKPPTGAFRYLAGLRRADGSYRYSARYAATPVWVTSQVLSALARKPLPLR
jgi:prenyltransferase/squalene oxidase-like repeat protein